MKPPANLSTPYTSPEDGRLPLADRERARRVLTDEEWDGWGCGPIVGAAIIIAIAGWYVCDRLVQAGF